jgi:hypothetical protein
MLNWIETLLRALVWVTRPYGTDIGIYIKVATILQERSIGSQVLAHANANNIFFVARIFVDVMHDTLLATFKKACYGFGSTFG